MANDEREEVDFTVLDGESVFILTAHNDTAREWIDENVGEAQGWAGGIVVEHRYISNIVNGIQEAGFNVKGVRA